VRSLNLLSTTGTKKSAWHISFDYYWSVACFLLLPAVYTEVRAFNFVEQENSLMGATLNSIGRIDLWTKWVLVKLAMMVVLYLLLQLLQLGFRFSNITALKTRHLFEIGFVGGLLAGLTQLFLVRVLGIYETGTVIGRIFSPIPVYIFFLFVLSALDTSIKSYKSETALAESEINSIRNLHLSQLSVISGYEKVSNELRNHVRNNADTALAKVADLGRSEVMVNTNIAKEIRLISDATIRNLSHKIALNYQATKTLESSSLFGSRGFNIFRLLRDSAQYAPLDPLRFTLACTLLVSGVIIRKGEFSADFLLVSVGFIFLYASQYAGQLLFKKFHVHNIFTIVLTTLISGLLPYNIVNSFSFRHNRFLDWDFRPNLLPMFFILFTVTFFGYLLQSGAIKSEEIVKRRNDEIARLRNSDQAINAELVQISRNWARHLHGHVQSQILAATLILESGQQDGDNEVVQEAFDLIMKILENASEFDYARDESLQDGVNKQISLWSEIIDIDLTVPPEIALRTGPQIRKAVEVVGEMITNASRHGGASKITIEIRRENPDELRIRAVDNGNHFVAKSKGFGTRFFDEVSRGRWDIARNAAFGETTVSVLMDLPDVEEFETSDLPLERAL